VSRALAGAQRAIRDRLASMSHRQRWIGGGATVAVLVAVTVAVAFAAVPSSAPAAAPGNAPVRVDQRANRGEARTLSPPATTSATAKPRPAATLAAPSAPRPPAPRPTRVAPKPVAPAPAGCSGYTGLQLTACRLLPSYGFSTSQMSALVPLWQRESGWNRTAANPSGAYGIPQALPGSKMASAGSDWRTNPATQVRWGLSYIRSTYGSPSAAWSFWLAHGWY
jgi:transglycosylase-like protein with SLT domain